MDLTLLVLAAGLSTRFGALKQLAPLGPGGETLLDYAVYDAWRAGIRRAVVVTRAEIERDLHDHLASRFGGHVTLEFAHQTIDDLPAGHVPPPGRTRPWGTGHAALSAEPLLTEPFVMCNADDFYGAHAYAVAARHLRSGAGRQELAFVGYRLDDTLSPSGKGVSRAVCELDDHGFLRHLTEVKQILRTDDALVGTTPDGAALRLTGDETVCTNLWALTPAVFPVMRRGFLSFLERGGADPEAEFLLGDAINMYVAQGGRVAVLPAGGPWFGITHPDDTGAARAQLTELVARGAYPRELRGP